MTKKRHIRALFVMGLLFLVATLPAAAKKTVYLVKNSVGEVLKGDTLYTTSGDFVRMQETDRPAVDGIEPLLPDKKDGLWKSHFTWGAEVGSTIDMTGHDLSTFNVDLLFGFKNSFIKLAGVGIGIHRAIQNGTNMIPVYAVFRTSFRKKPSLLFLEAQAGYSFNTWKTHSGDYLRDFTSALGFGINLSQSRRAKSYVILSAAYLYVNKSHQQLLELDTNNMYGVNLSFGVSF